MTEENDPSKHSTKPMCFVIGPIGGEGTDQRKHSDLLLYAVIKHALENGEFNYRVKRADEDTDPGMIGDRMVVDILHSDLVVADLTNLNANAFYELGIRHATEKPTIHVARIGTQLPFDTISHRTIFFDLSDWSSIESTRRRLGAFVRAARAPGYRVTNPITQANATFKMRESSDPRDQVISNLQERLAAIESQLDSKRAPKRRATAKEIFFLDTKPILKTRGAINEYRYDAYDTFGDLLDSIYYELHSNDHRIQAFKYDIQWHLEDDKGNRFTTTRKNGKEDNRSLADVGIFPSSILRVMPTVSD